MRMYLLLSLACILCSCNHNIVTIGKPITPGQLRQIQTGDPDYGVVLQRLGPPVYVYGHDAGFLFVYVSYDTDEKKLTLSYGQYGVKGKADYAQGKYYEQIVMFCFDHSGRLTKYGIRKGKCKQGWGTSLGPIVAGSDLIVNPFFEKYDYYRQRHIPIINALWERNIGTPRTEARDLKYLEKRNPQGVDKSLSLQSPKRIAPGKRSQSHDFIAIDHTIESRELSGFRWIELGHEKQQRPFSQLIPYGPQGIVPPKSIPIQRRPK